MLNVDKIHTYYGLSHILFDVSLAVSKGEVVGLLGRNGAGKSTTMRSIMGLTPPKEGSITFMGRSITGVKPYLLVRRGIGYVPDDRRVFADLSVDDNLESPSNEAMNGRRKGFTRFFLPLPTLEPAGPATSPEGSSRCSPLHAPS